MCNNISRNIEDVIYKIINKIPKEKNDFINSLLLIIRSSAFIAPEIINDQSLWIRLHHILNKYIGYERPTEEGWMKEVIDIYIGETI